MKILKQILKNVIINNGMWLEWYVIALIKK
jgi:hypothetical protein